MAEPSYDSMFGKLAVEQQFVTAEELKKALERYRTLSKEKPQSLEKLMIEMGFITRNQAIRLIQNIRDTSKMAANQIPGFQILGKLGQGAMAVVYKAKQLSLDRTVAVKVLPSKFTENPEYVSRFYKEGKAAALLNHPNIVQAIDVGESGGRHYFVMEYVEGKTIHDDLAAGKIFGEKEAIDIILQVASALAHAHAKNLIHRDVKPKNIMITTGGVVKLADMGLARATTDIAAAQSEAGKAYGTPYYIAPEQIRGELDIDARADIYALGATFYHMVTGRVPFEADNPSIVMKKHLKEQLVPPDHINTTLSGGISEVIEFMMAKRKEERYASAEELIQDLEAVRRGEAPMIAEAKLDMGELKGLEEGEAIATEVEEKPVVSATPYKIGLVAMSVVVVVLLVVIVMLLVIKH
jgi:eukaryotic-like serine/threonine-protein kinase